VVTFDNVVPYLGEIPPLGGQYVGLTPRAWRHAADLLALFKYSWWHGHGDTPIDPAATWAKGDQRAGRLATGNMIQLHATLPGDPDIIASAPIIEIIESHRYEWIFVGTNPANARFVVLDRVVSGAS
jgi:hypothetical protein